MEKYHKIMGPFKRFVGGENRNKVDRNSWTSEEFYNLRNVGWTFKEKVDGTNLRIHWDGHEQSWGGRTDNAQLHADLIKKIQDLFSEEIFEQTFGTSVVTLFGEGYGAGIGKGGGLYSPTKEFILFDARVNDVWLRPLDVCGVGESLGIPFVPVAGVMTLMNGIDVVTGGFQSQLRPGHFAEGLVGTPFGGLLDRQGQRIVVKLKHEDLFTDGG